MPPFPQLMDAVMLQLSRARNRLTTPATLTLPEIAASGLTVSAPTSLMSPMSTPVHLSEGDLTRLSGTGIAACPSAAPQICQGGSIEVGGFQASYQGAWEESGCSRPEGGGEPRMALGCDQALILALAHHIADVRTCPAC